VTVNYKRPVNLDLGSLKFPPMAITSILHRISGVVLFLLLPAILYFAGLSLHSRESFDQLKLMLLRPCFKLLLWAFSAAFAYHILAGFRHMIMDTGAGEELSVARKTSILVIVMAIILTILLGVWIW
jgi:succinate dehydrogenase / fumarate reductase cytochrome b subunit